MPRPSFCDQYLKIVTNIFRCPTSVTDTNNDPEMYFLESKYPYFGKFSFFISEIVSERGTTTTSGGTILKSEKQRNDPVSTYN